MAWIERWTAPDYTIDYYRGVGYYYSGVNGLNDCIVIDPITGFVMPNCVGYCWGRWYEAFGTRPYLSTGNAIGWYSYTVDGYRRSLTDPEQGAIACFAGGLHGGHVAVVERINYDAFGNISYLSTSNSAIGGPLFWPEAMTWNGATWEREEAGYTFQGFILPPRTETKAYIYHAAQRRFPNGRARIINNRRF